mmetsp:Transcript_38944/g.62906  ORF Transcript_38944/g.62906 Transcript_38944/m.62906 type:complete len:104 (+) Transcript_38944:147-458(+)
MKIREKAVSFRIWLAHLWLPTWAPPDHHKERRGEGRRERGEERGERGERRLGCDEKSPDPTKTNTRDRALWTVKGCAEAIMPPASKMLLEASFPNMIARYVAV